MIINYYRRIIILNFAKMWGFGVLGTISMKKQNDCSEPLYFYSALTLGDVTNNWKACITGDFEPSTTTYVPILSSEFLTYGFEVIQ